MNSGRTTGQAIESRIVEVRGQRVVLDADLARLYAVEVRVLNQAVKRNSRRFPADFMFRLEWEEVEALRSQSVILEPGRGRYAKYAPLAFTEHGVAMLSAVLSSQRAVQMSILIVRAFVKIREILASHKELAARVEKMEVDQKTHASIISILVDEIESLKKPKKLSEPLKRPIGFKISQ